MGVKKRLLLICDKYKNLMNWIKTQIAVLLRGARPPDGKLFSLFLIINICYRYSKEPSQRDGSFEHLKHMFKLMGKKIFTISR